MNFSKLVFSPRNCFQWSIFCKESGSKLQIIETGIMIWQSSWNKSKNENDTKVTAEIMLSGNYYIWCIWAWYNNRFEWFSIHLVNLKDFLLPAHNRKTSDVLWQKEGLKCKFFPCWYDEFFNWKSILETAMLSKQIIFLGSNWTRYEIRKLKMDLIIWICWTLDF